jgi:hypothetical protein
VKYLTTCERRDGGEFLSTALSRKVSVGPKKHFLIAPSPLITQKQIEKKTLKKTQNQKEKKRKRKSLK